MTILKNGQLYNTKDFMAYSFDGEMHYIHGLLYVPGVKYGYDSAKMVHELLKQSGSIPFKKLFGAFNYVIHQKNGNIYFFSDNSNLHCIYKSDLAVSSSYINLLSYLLEQGQKLSFNQESLCEYFTLGNIYFDKTHVNEIAILPNNRYLLFYNGLWIEGSKDTDVGTPSVIHNPQEFFDNLAASLSEGTVCQALTGGYDSRLIFTCLQKTISPQPFISANSESNPEVVIAKKVAGIAGKSLKVIHLSKPNLTEKIVKDIIWANDGMSPLMLDSDLRIFNFKEVMRQNGYNIQLTGDGGVLHKDWEWMQDLPFYRKRKTNLAKFYRQRIGYAAHSKGLSDSYLRMYSNQQKRFIRLLLPYVKDLNSQSYDSLYANVTGNRKILYNYGTPSYITYAPLAELELVRYSYHLPRLRRFFYNSMREITTEANPEIACIPTNYGTTASSNKVYLARDIMFQIIDYGRKGCRLISRKFGHNAFVSRVLDWSLENDFQRLAVTDKAVYWAISGDFLAIGTIASDLTYKQIQSLVHLYLLSDAFHISWQKY